MRFCETYCKTRSDLTCWKEIKQFNLNNAKVTCTLLPSGYNPLPIPTISTSQLCSHYQLVIGSLLYIMLGICPNITFSVIKMSQFSSNSSKEHLQKGFYIVWYLLDIRISAPLMMSNDKPISPLILFFKAVYLEELLNLLIDNFRLTIHLWVERCG